MSKEPVTVEQLMLAASILAAHKSFSDFTPSDPELLKHAYDYVRGCQEALEISSEREAERERADREKNKLLATYKRAPVLTYEQAFIQVTGSLKGKKNAAGEPALDEAKALAASWFKQAVNERSYTDPSWRQAKRLGIPISEIESLTTRVVELKKAYISEVNSKNASGPRKEEIEK
jgi:hypothetical protein